MANENGFHSVLSLVFDKTEKVFRLFIPGVVFLFLINFNDREFNFHFPFDLSSLTAKNINFNEIIILFFICLFIGMIIYAIHRSFFYFIDLLPLSRIAWIEKKCLYYSTAKYFNDNSNRDEKKRQDLFNRGAVANSGAMICELLIIFSIRDKINIWIFIPSVILFVLIVGYKIFIVRVEYEMNQIDNKKMNYFSKN